MPNKICVECTNHAHSIFLSETVLKLWDVRDAVSSHCKYMDKKIRILLFFFVHIVIVITIFI